MDSRILNELSREWLGFTPELLSAVESWSGARGMIFISQDTSSSAAASCLAKAVGGALFRYDDDRGAEWKASLDQIQAGLRSDGLFQSRALCVCVLIENLDDKPKWLLNRLADFMSAQPAGCLVVASARDSGNLPHRLAAMFVRLKKEMRRSGKFPKILEKNREHKLHEAIYGEPGNPVQSQHDWGRLA